MTTKHTAGKWVNRGTGCVGTNRKLVAVVYPMEDENFEEQAANIRLIAAAPDLLEALQMLLEFPNTGPATTTARSAIAKATGEQP